MTTSIDRLDPLEPEVRAHLDAGGVPDFDIADVPPRRAWLTEEIDRMFMLFGEPGPDVARISDHQVPVGGGTILVRSYHPSIGTVPSNDKVPAAPLPAHILLHGGGWTTGSIKDLVVDAEARHRAAAAACVVLTVEYRLAPEHRFPTAVHDVVDTVRWIRAHAAELGIDSDVITLGGSSAGGNLAAAAVAADPNLAVRTLVLEVPACDLRTQVVTNDVIDAGDRFVPDELALIALVLPEYLGDIDLADSPLASPVLADLERFPETHILTAEHDMLRPGAERLAAGLQAAGVPVTIMCYPGALHGSPILTATWPTARRWQTDVLALLNDIHRRATATPTSLPGRVS